MGVSLVVERGNQRIKDVMDLKESDIPFPASGADLFASLESDRAEALMSSLCLLRASFTPFRSCLIKKEYKFKVVKRLKVSS
jgi:hypothetical protein